MSQLGIKGTQCHLLNVAKYTGLRCLVCAIPKVNEIKQPNCTRLGSFTIVNGVSHDAIQ